VFFVSSPSWSGEPDPSAPSAESASKVANAERDDVDALVKGNTGFALDLYAELAEANRTENLIFSPYSISSALAMTYAGARGNTARQMKHALRFGLAGKKLHGTFSVLGGILAPKHGEERAYDLVVANAFWAQKGRRFLDLFTQVINEYYGAEIKAVDFAGDPGGALEAVNDWVRSKTSGKIANLLQRRDLNAPVDLMLTNVAYFNGTWAVQFNEHATKERTFRISPSQRVQAPMMHWAPHGRVEPGFRYLQRGDFQALEMIYTRDLRPETRGRYGRTVVDGDISMVILLPKEVDGLGDLEKKLTSSNLTEWLKALAVQRQEKVEVLLPKFRFGASFELRSALQGLGMGDAFGAAADFSGMGGTRSIFLSKAIHKAFVAVDEKGTEAAAATAVVMARSASEPVARFEADRPFIFLIRDNRSGSILFLGRVINPLEG